MDLLSLYITSFVNSINTNNVNKHIPKLHNVQKRQQETIDLPTDQDKPTPSVKSTPKAFKPQLNINLDKLIRKPSPVIHFFTTIDKESGLEVIDFSYLESLPVDKTKARYGGKLYIKDGCVHGIKYRKKYNRKGDPEAFYPFAEKVFKSTLWLLWVLYSGNIDYVKDIVALEPEAFQEFKSMHKVLNRSQLLGTKEWTKDIQSIIKNSGKYIKNATEVDQFIWDTVYRPDFANIPYFYPYVDEEDTRPSVPESLKQIKQFVVDSKYKPVFKDTKIVPLPDFDA